MATRQKRGSRTTVKKEASLEDSEMLDEQLQDDALERAENLLAQKKAGKSSPGKKVSALPKFYSVTKTRQTHLLTNQKLAAFLPLRRRERR